LTALSGCSTMECAGGVTPKLVAGTRTPTGLRPSHLSARSIAQGRIRQRFYGGQSAQPDIIVDPAGAANAAFIVVDIETGAARRVLEGASKASVPEKVDLVIDGAHSDEGRRGPLGPAPYRRAIPSPRICQNEWVYFGPMHGTSLYRIKAGALADENLIRTRSVNWSSATATNRSATKSASTRTIILSR